MSKAKAKLTSPEQSLWNVKNIVQLHQEVFNKLEEIRKKNTTSLYYSLRKRNKGGAFDQGLIFLRWRNNENAFCIPFVKKDGNEFRVIYILDNNGNVQWTYEIDKQFDSKLKETIEGNTKDIIGKNQQSTSKEQLEKIIDMLSVCNIDSADLVNKEEFFEALSKQYEAKNIQLKEGQFDDDGNITDECIFEANPNKNPVSLAERLVKMLRQTKNIILTGAPGTGKTYLAKNIAACIVKENDNTLYKDLIPEEKSRIGFVQFHPSYDYTDFVEGLRSRTDANGQLFFEKKSGIFWEFCKKAIEKPQCDWEKAKLETDWLKKIGIKNVNNEKTISGLTIKKVTRDKISCTVDGSDPLEFKLDGLNDLFHQDRETIEDNAQKTIFNILHSEKFIKELVEKGAATIPDPQLSNYVFIIDEINRGEVSKIFGELFYAIDPGYRGEDGKIRTQYANMQTEANIFDNILKEKEIFGHFFVPKNVYIIGTMNNIDRSVESLDFAFQRRFPSYDVKYTDTLDAILEDFKNGSKDNKDFWQEARNRLTALNNEIQDSKDYLLGSNYCLGGSYLRNLKHIKENIEEEEKGKENNDTAFEILWNYYIERVLRDYFKGVDKTTVDEYMVNLKTAYDLKDNNHNDESDE